MKVMNIDFMFYMKIEEWFKGNNIPYQGYAFQLLIITDRVDVYCQSRKFVISTSNISTSHTVFDRKFPVTVFCGADFLHLLTYFPAHSHSFIGTFRSPYWKEAQCIGCGVMCSLS